MQKSKLTKKAIKFIVDSYDDENVNYRFSDIKTMVKNEFGIEVSTEAIRKNYHKFKGETENKVLKTNKEKEVSSNQENINVIEKWQSAKIVKSDEKFKRYDDTFAENLTKDDINSLLKGN